MNPPSKVISQRMRVLIISLVISLLIMAIKWWAYVLSGSVALKTDALESFINIAALVMAMIAVYHSERPADLTHPYGHGKIEIFSSAIEGGMLLFAGCFLIYESLQNMLLQTPLEQLNFAITLSAVSGVMNGALGFWQLKEGKILNSQAIIADAKHILSDFYTSVAILLGLLIAIQTQWYFIDPILAIAVAIILLKHSYEILKKAAALLSDSEDPELLNTLVKEFNSSMRPEEIIDIHRVRSLRIGQKTFVDLHLVVPEFWDVRLAHDKAEEFCSTLKQKIHEDIEFHPHVEPCMKNFCSNCPLQNCKIRKSPFNEKPTFTLENIISSSPEDD